MMCAGPAGVAWAPGKASDAMAEAGGGPVPERGFVVSTPINTVIGIVRLLRAKRVIDDMAHLGVSEYRVVRDDRVQTPSLCALMS